MDIHDYTKEIHSKEDFVKFLIFLKNDFVNNKKDWENDNLLDFLESLSAYAEDVDGYYKNMNLPFDKNNPTWSDFAQILLGARIYE